jgi:hypothetical protein
MPISVPTTEEFNQLTERVTKLESVTVTPQPPEPPTPPIPTSYVYDDFPVTYDIKTDNTLSANGKYRVVYCGFNPSNPSDKGQAGVRVPSNVPQGVTMPRVFYAQPYSTPNTGTGNNATLTLTEAQFSDFDLTFYMRCIKGGRSPTPHNWETAWILPRFNPAGYPVTDRRAHFHHYFYDIQRNGVIEFGRKDNNEQLEEQTFLTTSGRVVYSDGKWFKIRLRAVGNKFTNWVDDVLKFDILDDGKIGTRKKQVITNGVASSVPIPVEPPSQLVSTGRIGNYAEDSVGEWGPYTILKVVV